MKQRLVFFVALSILGLIAFQALSPGYFTYDNFMSFWTMTQHCHPAWASYEFRIIREGADLDEVIRTTKPSQVVDRGDFTMLRYETDGETKYFGSLYALAYRGKMIHATATSCSKMPNDGSGDTWVREFFDARTPELDEELDAIERHQCRCWMEDLMRAEQAEWQEREDERLARFNARFNADVENGRIPLVAMSFWTKK